MQMIKSDLSNNSDLIAEVPTYMGEASIRLFAFGFLEMAEHSAGLAGNNTCSIDAVVPAILYNIRHSVELFLKYILYDLKAATDSDAILGHSVKRLYDDHIDTLEIALGCEPDSGFHHNEWLTRLQAVVYAIHEVDPDGQSLRYPANGNLIANHGGGYRVSIYHIKRCIEEIKAVYSDFDLRSC